MLSDMRRSWQLLAARGLLALGLGLTALFWTDLAVTLLIYVAGACALLGGVLTLSAGLMSRSLVRGWWLLLLEAAAALLFAGLCFARPTLVAEAIVMVLGIWAIVAGIFGLGFVIALRRTAGAEWAYGLLAVSAIALGILLLARPAAGLELGGWLLGAYGIGSGAMLLTFAWRYRSWVDSIEGLPGPR